MLFISSGPEVNVVLVYFLTFKIMPDLHTNAFDLLVTFGKLQTMWRQNRKYSANTTQMS